MIVSSAATAQGTCPWADSQIGAGENGYPTDAWCVDPTTDGRELVLVRHTEPDSAVGLLRSELGIELPPQPPPKIRYSSTASM